MCAAGMHGRHLNHRAAWRHEPVKAIALRQLADRQVALVEIERKLSVAIDAAGDGLFELDVVSGLHGDTNWMALLGYGPGEIAMPIPDWRAFVHPDDVADVEAEYARHLAGETE